MNRPRIRIFFNNPYFSEEDKEARIYGVLINGYDHLPVPQKIFNTMMGSFIFFYNNSITVHIRLQADKNGICH